MPTWILADVHGGADPAADQDLVAFLGRAKKERVELIVLGDLFCAWLGPSKFHTTFQAQVLGLLEELRNAGGQVRFVVGNRDYLAEAELGRAFDEVICEPKLIVLGGKATWIAHGDGTDPGDLWYARWRALSRSRAASWALKKLPGPVGQSLAERLEKAMRSSNPRYKTGVLPKTALEALGRRAKERGAVRALVGHFHVSTTLPVEGGAPVTVAPAWLEHRQFLRVEPETGEFVSENGASG